MENKLQIPADRRQTSWLFTSAAEELNSGLLRTKFYLLQQASLGWELNPDTRNGHGNGKEQYLRILYQWVDFCDIPFY